MMKLLRCAVALVGAMALTLGAKAQGFTPKRGAILDGRTVVKTNLFGYAVGSYSLSVERVFGKRFSLQAGYSKMPAKNVLAKISIADDIRELKNANLGSQSLSLDARIYLSRMGYGHGFYLQPYFRQEHHEVSGFELQDKRTLTGASHSEDRVHPYQISGNIKANSFGLAFGVQWLIGKGRNFVIDWTILGGHYSKSSKTTFEAVYKGAVPAMAEQAAKDYQEDLDNWVKDVPFLKDELQHQVIDNGRLVRTQAKTPYVFLRGSLSLGFRF